jgi:uncharacterized coiled-coil DUF342 family protein
MIKFLVSFSIMMFLVSCSNVDTETITEINKWQEKLDSSHQVYLATDIDTLKKIAWKVNENNKAIKRLNEADTVDKELVKLLDEYKWIRKKLKNVDAKMYDYGTEFEELKVQLENLKLDVQNGVRTSEENNQYLSNEIKSIKVLIARFSKEHKIYVEAQKKFGKVGEPIQLYVNQLKSDKGIIK